MSLILKKIIHSLTFNTCLFFLLLIGIQNSSNKIKVNLIQNSAISFIVCIEDINGNLNNLLIDIKAKYNVNICEKVNIYSIRNYNESAIKKIEKNKKILVKQITQKTVQIVSQE